MNNGLDLAHYLNAGAERLIHDILRTTFKNPRETAFWLRFREQESRSARKRLVHEEAGHHIPPFLIASITSACNLYCKGCYARANGLCGSASAQDHLTSGQWDRIFTEAGELGISFILLAGGEPMLRKDVLDAAAGHKNILFPIFTNGTLLDAPLLALLDRHRNLVPVVSLEGDEEATDNRRGTGTYALLQKSLASMVQKKLLFGASITVTTENIEKVTSPGFIEDLYNKGCRVVFFIEYVPAAPHTEGLAPGDAERSLLEKRQQLLRESYPGMLFLSFPGDEKEMGGCLAAGRGFFHINPTGGAEPCPFSPYSQTNVKDHTLLEVLDSPFFQKIREANLQEGEHRGGCTLFEKEDQVRALLFPQ